MPERQHLGGDLKVGVLVDQRHIVDISDRGNQVVGHADSTMATAAGQLSLCGECRLPVFVIGWQVFVRQAAV